MALQQHPGDMRVESRVLNLWMQRGCPEDDLLSCVESVLSADGLDQNTGLYDLEYDITTRVLSIAFMRDEVEGDFDHGDVVKWGRYFSQLRFFRDECGAPAAINVHVDAFLVLDDNDWSTPRSPSFMFAICSTAEPDVGTMSVALPDDACTDWLFWSWYVDFVTSFGFDVWFDDVYPCRYQLDLVVGWESALAEEPS
jgi:hypothetical protein